MDDERGSDGHLVKRGDTTSSHQSRWDHRSLTQSTAGLRPYIIYRVVQRLCSGCQKWRIFKVDKTFQRLVISTIYTAFQWTILTQLPEIFTQLPEIFTQSPGIFIQLPEIFTQLPEIFTQLPGIFIQLPEIFFRLFYKENNTFSLCYQREISVETRVAKDESFHCNFEKLV